MVAQRELEDANPDKHRVLSHRKRDGKMFVACRNADPQIVHTTYAMHSSTMIAPRNRR